MRCFGTESILLLLMVASAWAASSIHPILSDAYIEQINRDAVTWTAGRNFPPRTSIHFLKGLAGVLPHNKLMMPRTKLYPKHELKDLPDEFDARTAWPECPIINEIRDQGNCGSCWAVSSVSVMSDRICIQTKGQVQFRYSDEDLISCCENCGNGCYGGWTSSAFDYWKYFGIVSGGPYNSSEGCMPYEIAPCEHHVDGDRPQCVKIHPTPACVQQCNEGYNVDYMQDRHKSVDVYMVGGYEKMIMTEILRYGPVSAVFKVFSDFYHYKSGVYRQTNGYLVGEHGVKILGWGVENGIKYWLCANSWNTDWGDKGFFKIKRGLNECGIEEQILAGNVATNFQ